MSVFKLGNFSKDTTTTCDNGYYLLGGVCTLCPEQYYCDGVIKTKCGDTYYCPVGTGTSTNLLSGVAGQSGGTQCPGDSSVSYTNNAGCITKAPCSSYQPVPDGKVRKAGGYCQNATCDKTTGADGIADLDTCFENKALCSSYGATPNNMVERANFENIHCAAAACSSSDINICFENGALCSSYGTTPNNMVERANFENIRCAAATCSSSDRDICFEDKALCGTYISSVGAPDLDVYVAKDSTIRCAAAACASDVDLNTCFAERAMCSGQALHLNADKVRVNDATARCAGAHFVQLVDMDTCYETRALCSSYTTPYGYVPKDALPDLTRYCQGTSCATDTTNTNYGLDLATCFDNAAPCTEFTPLPSGKFRKIAAAGPYCQGSSCATVYGLASDGGGGAAFHADIATCFGQSAQCSSYDPIPDGKLRKATPAGCQGPGCGGYCKNATCDQTNSADGVLDRATCFDDKASCADMAALYGTNDMCPGVQIQRPDHSGHYCQAKRGAGTVAQAWGSTCIKAPAVAPPSADQTECCSYPANCNTINPPDGYKRKVGTHYCETHSCTEVGHEDLNKGRCFDQDPAKCNTLTPVNGMQHVADADKKFCASNPCVGSSSQVHSAPDVKTCLECGTGEEFALGSSACTPVPKGTYKHRTGISPTLKIQCPNGFYTRNTGSTSASDCVDPNAMAASELPTNVTLPNWQPYSATNTDVCYGGYMGGNATTAAGCGKQIRVVKALNPKKAIFGTFLGVNNSCRWGMGESMAKAKEACTATRTTTTTQPSVGAWQVMTLSVPPN